MTQNQITYSMTTSGKSQKGEIIFQEGDEDHLALTEQPSKLYQLPEEYGQRTNATGSTSLSIVQIDDSARGRVIERSIIEKLKHEFWKHAKTWLNILGGTIIAAILAFFGWYIPHSNKIAGDVADAKNLKHEIELLRNEKNREIDKLERQIEILQNRGVNNIPLEP